MFRILRYAITIFSAFLFSLLSNSQTKEPVSVPSPDVASLGTFGSIPVGSFTGQPDISIPIYNLFLTDKISVPIEAKYNLSNVNLICPNLL